MFYINLQFFADEISTEYISEEPIIKFELPPHGLSKPEDFNILSHVFIEPKYDYTLEGEEPPDDKEKDRRKI